MVARSALPDARKVVRDGLIFHSDFYFPKRHRLIEELIGQRLRMQETLGIEASEEPIHVFLFEDEPTFREFLNEQHPSFPDRRAFFLRSPTNLVVYAHWNAKVAEDLRHEVAHGYLHSSVPNVPIWLDEGIAEFFESGPNAGGRHAAHISYLTAEYTAGHWKPDLKRLETLTQPGELSQLDYAEAWLWARFLTSHSSETQKMLSDFLEACQHDTKEVTPLSELLKSADVSEQKVTACLGP